MHLHAPRATKRLSAALLLVAPLAAAPAIAQGDAPSPDSPQTMIIVESKGLASMLVDENDKALRDALALLPAKVDELRTTVPEFAEMPKDFSDSIFLAMSSPWRMAVTNKGFDQQTGKPGVGMVMSWRMPEADGRSHAMMLHRSLDQVMKMADFPMPIEPSAAHEMMSSFTVPFMFPLPVHFGPREAGDGWRYEIHVGDAPDADAAFAGMPDAKGLDHFMRGKVDLASFTPFVNMFAGMAAMAGPQAVTMIDELRDAGMIGKDAITMDFVTGYEKGKSVSHMTMRGLGVERGEMLGMSSKTITKGDLAAVPADATFAEVKKMDFQKQWQSMREQIAMFAPHVPIDEVLGQFKQMTGFDLETQVIPSIGDTSAFYLSDSTGGSSFFSSVMLLKLKDPETFHDFWMSLTGIANGMIAQEIAGEPFSFRFAHFEIDGTPFTQIQVPTIPVPIEPTFSVANGWLVVGITPQACMAAVRQVAFPRGDLSSNPSFKQALSRAPDFTSVVFVDSARTLRDGYPYMTMLGSAVTNLVRPRSLDAPGQPGMVTPFYADLSKDAHPYVMYTHWDGDDFVTESHSDASMLVNVAAILGVGDIGDIASSMLLGGAIGAGIANETNNNVYNETWDEEWEDDWEEDHDHDHEHHDEEHEHHGAH